VRRLLESQGRRPVVFISGPNRAATEQICNRLNTEYDAKYLLEKYQFVPSTLGVTAPDSEDTKAVENTVDPCVTGQQWGNRAACRPEHSAFGNAPVEDNYMSSYDPDAVLRQMYPEFGASYRHLPEYKMGHMASQQLVRERRRPAPVPMTPPVHYPVGYGFVPSHMSGVYF